MGFLTCYRPPALLRNESGQVLKVNNLGQIYIGEVNLYAELVFKFNDQLDKAKGIEQLEQVLIPTDIRIGVNPIRRPQG